MAIDLKNKTTIEGEKKETAKELSAEEKKQEQHQKDSQIAEKAISGLKSAGTAEGHEARKRAADSADRAVKQEAQKLEQAEKKISDKGSQAEKELKQTSDVTKGDAKQAESAAGQVKFDGAKKELQAITKASKEAAAFLDKTQQERIETRKGADSKTKAFASKVKGMNLKIPG